MKRTGTRNQVEFIVCGRFEESAPDKLRADRETNQLIEALEDALHRKELQGKVGIGFCNCGNAYEHGPSITILPEKVRYLDVDRDDIETYIDRHVEPIS